MMAPTERLKAAREHLREVGRGLSPRYRTGTESLTIVELISPLRYDVEVRARFFAFLAANRALLDDSPDRFLAAAEHTDYATWFRLVAVHAIGIAGRPEAEIDAAFRRRVLRSVALADSVAAKGFIAKPPLTVRASPRAVTSSGKQMGPRCYALDGCHRLALLRQLGRHHLEPGEYRVTVGSGALLDNTAALIGALGLDEARYVEFIGSGYGAGAVADRDELLQLVAVEQPERLAELRSVLVSDELRLAR